MIVRIICECDPGAAQHEQRLLYVAVHSRPVLIHWRYRFSPNS
jgi:hypothetical protein